MASAPKIDPSKLANWLSSDLFGLLNEAGLTIEESRVLPAGLSEIVLLVEDGVINATSGKTILSEIFNHGGSPSDVIERKGLEILNDREEIRSLIDEVLESNPEQVDAYRQGKDALTKWLFGQVMRRASGRADPALVEEILERRLRKLRPTDGD